MRRFLLSLSLTPLLFGACMRNRDPEPGTEVIATPTGPCRDDEAFDAGRCSPRVQGTTLAPR